MPNKKPKYWVVIPAAGSGQRMRSPVLKQYLKFKGKTVLEHTLSLFLERNDIAGINVCIASDDIIGPTLPAFLDPKVTSVHGGDSRAQSVLKGLFALNDKANDDDWVLVHDAARPCLSKLALGRLLNELKGDEVGGILAIPAKDTLKMQSKGETANIARTLDRSMVWQAQTPQMFRFKLLKDALNWALEHNKEITDEASAVEMAGYKPLLIKGETRNLKITTPEDLELTEFLLNKMVHD